MSKRYKNFKERCRRADNAASQLTGAPQLNSHTRTFLDTDFGEQVSTMLTACAQQNPLLREAIATTKKRQAGASLLLYSFPQAMKTAALAEEAAFYGEAMAVAGETLVAAAPIVGPAIAVLAVGVAVYELYSVMKSSYEVHAQALAEYENAVRNHAKLVAQNRLKLDIDRHLPEPVSPRVPHLRDRRRIRPRPPAPRYPPLPEPVYASSKFTGVLTKCEPVVGSSDQIVARFDSISVLLTKSSNSERIDLNTIPARSIQDTELEYQLGIYGLSFSPLPSYMVTTTMTRNDDVNESEVGKWFQFDLTFTVTGEAEVIAIIPAVTFGIGRLAPRRVISSVADTSMRATIDYTTLLPLSSAKQTEITRALGLSSASRRKRETDSKEIDKELKVIEDEINENAPKTRPKRFLEGLINAWRLTNHHPDISTIAITKVLVANVGQGNTNVLYDADNVIQVVFDLGVGGTRMTQENEQALVDKIVNDDPIIVISHWDLDHYRLLTIHTDLQSGTFIVPSYDSKAGQFVTQVYNGINHAGNRLSYSPTQTSLPRLGNVHLHMTVGAAAGNRNNYGAITACIFNNVNAPKFLMPADASYSNVVNAQKYVYSYAGWFNWVQHSSLQYLVASHHGSSNGLTDIPTPLQLQQPAGSFVLFSYGDSNQYGHNARSVWADYRRAGWTNYRTTVNANTGIVVDLLAGTVQRQ